MKIRTILSLALVVSLLSNVPVMAAEVDDWEQSNVQGTNLEQQLDSLKRYEQKPKKLSSEEANSLFGDDESQISTAAAGDPDSWESNDSLDTAYPYSRIPTGCTSISTKTDLYRLGMKAGTLHNETDEDWYSITLTAGKRYFVDIRNVGLTNNFIELYYFSSDGNKYYYTTDPSKKPIYAKKPEKYFYITAPETCTYFIRINNGGDWTGHKAYYFYVGPEVQTFGISHYPIGGGFYLSGNYQTVSLSLSGVVPEKTSIINMSITDNFVKGNPCPEVDKYMRVFGGKTYYNTSGTGSSTINNISGVSLGGLWIIGAKCARNLHASQWSGYLNGSFQCIMAPHPGNELN